MTTQERKKLAKAARELAMECAAGTAPEFGTGSEWDHGNPNCAIGHAAYRAGMQPWDCRDGESPVVEALKSNTAAWWAVTNANDYQTNRPGLPWALLWLADELESAR